MGIILVRIQSKCGGNADQNNDEYGHFLCSIVGIFHWFSSSFWLIFINFSNINLLILPSSLLAGLINQILGWLLKFGYQKKPVFWHILRNKSLHKDGSFPLRISSVNMTKSAGIGALFTQWVADWFKQIKNKTLCKSATFDVKAFYPSIKECLLRFRKFCNTP